MDICGTAACDDSFLYCRSCCVQSVFHTEFCFFHLSLCSRADTDNRYAACQFCKSFLKLLSVKVRCCLFDRFLDLCNSVIDRILASEAVNDDCVLFLYFNGFCTSKLLHCSLFQVEAEFFGDHLAACQDRDILEHLFSSVAVARCLHCNYIECTAQFVDDQGCERLALDVLCDDEESCAGLYNLLKERQDILDVGDLLVCDQDVRIFQDCFHLLHICSHVCGNVSAVKLHTFYKVQFCLHCLGLFDRDNAVVGYFLHRVRHHLSDSLVS